MDGMFLYLNILQKCDMREKDVALAYSQNQLLEDREWRELFNREWRELYQQGGIDMKTAIHKVRDKWLAENTIYQLQKERNEKK